MDVAELSDLFPGINDEDISSFNFEQEWVTGVFDNILDKDLADDFLGSNKLEPIDSSLLGFADDLIVGGEVEVNDSTESCRFPAIADLKSNAPNNQEILNQNLSSDTSSEIFQLSPEVGSSCSNESQTSDPYSVKLKRSPDNRTLDDQPISKKSMLYLSQPTITCDANVNNRFHYVIQKGQTLILQTEKPNKVAQRLSPSCRIRPINVHNPHVIRSDGNEYIRVKPLITHQKTSSLYPLTSPGSQTSSDTEGGTDSPREEVDPRGHFNLFATRLGHSVTSSSAVRPLPAGVIDRYNVGSSYSGRSCNETSQNNSDYTSGYGTSSSSCSLRQQPLFPNSSNGILVLTDEEKRTLIAEGYPVPNRLPLSKQEERNLKKIRRKIKNKISAQESRRKKKEYVETLEKRVEGYSHEITELRHRQEALEATNRALLGQLRQLQQLANKANITINTTSTTNTPMKAESSPSAKKFAGSSSINATSSSSSSSSTSSACLMVFLFCFAALFAGQPNSSQYVGHHRGFYSPQRASGHIVGDLTTFSSLHQIGYTWSGGNRRLSNQSGPKIDGEYARGPNMSHAGLGASGTGTTSLQHHPFPQWTHDLHLREAEVQMQPQGPSDPVNKPLSRSIILGSHKDFEDCEPLTWWEYFYGTSSLEHSDADETQHHQHHHHRLDQPIHMTIANRTMNQSAAVERLFDEHCIAGFAKRTFLRSV